MQIKIKGLPLVLNTIQYLEPLKEVWLCHNSIMFSENHEMYVYKNAQFSTTRTDNYNIPIQKDAEGVILIDFSEVGLAFNILSPRELEKYNKDDWYIVPDTPIETLKSEKDWIKRMSIDDALESFHTYFTDESYPDENLICLKETIILRLASYSDRTELEELIEHCKRDFEKEFKENNGKEAIPERTLQKIFQKLEETRPYLHEIQTAAENRLLQLPAQETQESMQKDLNAALELEDYTKAEEIKNNMLAKGFTPAA